MTADGVDDRMGACKDSCDERGGNRDDRVDDQDDRDECEGDGDCDDVGTTVMTARTTVIAVEDRLMSKDDVGTTT